MATMAVATMAAFDDGGCGDSDGNRDGGSGGNGDSDGINGDSNGGSGGDGERDGDGNDNSDSKVNNTNANDIALRTAMRTTLPGCAQWRQ